MFSDSSFFLYGRFNSIERDELKGVIEKNGGKVTRRLASKTSYIVCSLPSPELLEQGKKHKTPIISDQYILDCMSSHKQLPVSNYVFQEIKNHKKTKSRGLIAPQISTDSHNVYNFGTIPSPDTDKENYIDKIREKLKKVSLKSNSSKRGDPDEDEREYTSSSKKLKMSTANGAGADNSVENNEKIIPLKNLVFFICGKFSIPMKVLRDIILDNGGTIATVVDEKVTHFLFGGENVDIPEFHEAQKLKIHIVNEYFLRLLVKY